MPDVDIIGLLAGSSNEYVTQLLMPFSHQEQITLTDILRYEDMRIKYGCLPGIAFSNSEIFTAVFLERRGCCAPVTWG